jgi:two-component system, OmpR family, sensor kinase
VRPLHLRLLLTLLAILLPAGALLVTTALGAARAYHAEVIQRQNVDLARNLLAEGAGVGDDAPADLGGGDLDDLIDMMAMANPGVEIYLLDDEGRVIGAPKDVEVMAEGVDLRAVERFLAVAAVGAGPDAATPVAGFPVWGTDPRRGGRAPFAAAPLAGEGGYLYVVLTDEARASLLRSVQTSTTLRLVLWGGAVGLAVAALVGAAAFALLTRRLRRLDAAVRDFDPVTGPLGLVVPARPRDEIDALAAGFAALGDRVRAQVAALESADRTRRELITNVSHDLRTPLTALRASLEAAESRAAASGTALSDRHLATARRSAERLAREIDQLFELSTLEGTEPPLHVEAFPLADLAHDVAQKFGSRAEAQAVTLEVDVATTLPFVAGDLALVERALGNLLDNALRHVAAGGHVVVRSRRVGDRAVLEVQDDGEGLDPALFERVFERFFRAERARGGEGSGLGLAIVRRVAVLHGGEPGVRSQPGEGATFWFSLPLAGP